MEKYDVAIIGAGPAGSMAAKYAVKAKAAVLLLEEHRSAGWPVQCAGLLGIKAIEESELAPGSFLMREVRGAKVHSPSGFTLSFKAEDTKAWVVNRRLFDRALVAEAVQYGDIDFRVASPVTGLTRDAGWNVLSIGRGSDSWKAKAKVVISAEGVGAKIARSAGIPGPEKILSSAQVEVPFKTEDPESVEIYIGRDVAPGFFAWAIPTGDGAARVGLSSRANACDQLKRFLKSRNIRDRVVPSPIGLVVGGLPLGPSPSTVAEGLLAVGDVVGQVKPTSGGGIYPGLVSAKIAGEVAATAALEGDNSAKRLAEYERRWRKALGRELSLGMRAHGMMARMKDEDMDYLVCKMNESEKLVRIIERYGDIDEPSLVMKKLAPRLGLSMARMMWRLYKG